MSQSPTDKKILIIDDESLILENLTDIFELEKWKVATANSAQVAIEKIPEFNPTVILSDINMPGMSGLELLALLNSQNSLIPIILLSGYRDMNKMQKAWENNVFDFLDKPYEESKLISVANSAHEFGPEYIIASRKRTYLSSR